MGVEVRQGFPSLPVAFLLLIIRGQWLFQARAANFLSSNNYFYFFLTERDLNSNIEDTKNVFPTACHRLLPSLPCLSPSLQPEHDHLAKRRERTSPQLGHLALQCSHAGGG